MKIDFDQSINRVNTSSMKWDGREKRFGDKDVLPMWVADMDFLSPGSVIDGLKNRVEHGVFGYVDVPETYYEAIIQWMKRRHGFDIRSEWLAYSPGVVSTLSLIVEAFTNPGDKVLIQSPVYRPFFEVVKRNNRIVENNPLKLENGRYTMDFEDLESKLDTTVKLMILCSPHNPVGRVWTRDELTRLGELCLKNNILVVSDEIHADLVYKPYTQSPFASISDEFAMNSITCIAPSKTFNLPGLKAAAAIIPNPELRKTYNNLLHKFFLDMYNCLSVVALENAYNHGDQWLDELIEYLQGNLGFLTRYIAEQIPEIKVIQPEGTYLVWLDCRGLGLDPHDLQRFMLQEAKVAMNEGAIFGPGGEGFMRMNIACPHSVLEEGLQRIHQAVKRYTASK